ncbi:DUF6308 family protein [Dactylosporangium sp. NPDC049140]|uniref:DUF6308 family protein n=1 Tax=Dactylosporangium sp. NPDC049140 TaxID=3155647 RepID=UPI0033FF217C
MPENLEPRHMFTEGSVEQVERVAAVVDALLADPRTPAAVQTFYDPVTQFAGDTFLSLAPNDPQTISPADLLAVSLLTVSPGAVAVRALLPGGRIADQVSELLATIPADVPLWDASDLDLARADTLWNLLKTTDAGVELKVTSCWQAELSFEPQFQTDGWQMLVTIAAAATTVPSLHPMVGAHSAADPET